MPARKVDGRMGTPDASTIDLEITGTPTRRRARVSRCDELAEVMVSRRTGIVQAIELSHHPIAARRLFLYSVAVGDQHGTSGERWVFSGGISWDWEHAATAALAEGFERHVWSQPTGEPAYLDPAKIDSDAFRAADFVRIKDSEPLVDHRHSGAPFEPAAHPYLPGRDLLTGDVRWALAGALLPAYDHPTNHGYLCDLTTTGMAAGSDAPTALVGATAEVIERDAFSISYLNRLELPEIDLHTVTDPALQAVLAATTARPGVRVRAWDMTLDIRVPSVLCALLIDIDDETTVRLGSASHPSAVVAMRKALAEAIKLSSVMRAAGVRLNRRQSRPITPATVLNGPDDHAALGDLPEYVATLDWLLRPRSVLRTFGQLETMSCPTSVPAEALEWILRRLDGCGLRAYAFDLTPPYLVEATGLQAWRVLIPGAQPLTFGGACVGMDSERLRWAPVRAGFLTEPLPDDGFNPLPHCFS
jgi:ribosomal protein S12 methylthiotransferase accessory factor